MYRKKKLEKNNPEEQEANRKWQRKNERTETSQNAVRGPPARRVCFDGKMNPFLNSIIAAVVVKCQLPYSVILNTFRPVLCGCGSGTGSQSHLPQSNLRIADRTVQAVGIRPRHSHTRYPKPNRKCISFQFQSISHFHVLSTPFVHFRLVRNF